MNLNMDAPYLVEERNTVLLPTNGDYNDFLPPDARMINVKGYVFYAAKNTPELNALLYQNKTPIPAPIFFDDYDWSNVEFYSVQAEMAGLVSSRRRCYNLSELGAGKTIGSVLAVDYLIRKGYTERALVVGPLSILDTVWSDTILTHFPHLRTVILHGSAKKRWNLLWEDFWNVAIINFEGINTIREPLLDRQFKTIIIDEASAYRDHTTRRWRVMKQMVDRADFVCALTATPTPNAPSDAYGLGLLVTPERMPRSFKRFRERVEKEGPPGIFTARRDAAETVAKHLQPAVRFLRSEIVELKEPKFRTHKVILSAKQEAALKELKLKARIDYPEGTVTAVNAAVLVNKLMQICAGQVYTVDKVPIDLEPENRLETVATIANSAEGKIIVITPFIHTAQYVYSRLKDRINSALVIGDVPRAERATIFRRFQDRRDKLRNIVAHPKILSHGLNLTQADTIVWYSPIHSRELYEQVNGRIVRLGQTRQPWILHLCATREEQAVYNVIEKRGTMQAAVLEAFALKTMTKAKVI